MFKSLLLSLILVTGTAGAAGAQGWADDSEATAGAAQGEAQGNFTFNTDSEAARQAGRGYILENPGGGVSRFGGWSSQGRSHATTTNKVPLPAVVTAMPIIQNGINTGLIGGSMALHTEHGDAVPTVHALPRTGVDSITWQAVKLGKADRMLGEEGTTGPSPARFFTPDRFLDNAIIRPTTGHRSDAPSAWGTPLKNNSMEGPIHGL
jgi:hypothetical protein